MSKSNKFDFGDVLRQARPKVEVEAPKADPWAAAIAKANGQVKLDDDGDEQCPEHYPDSCPEDCENYKAPDDDTPEAKAWAPHVAKMNARVDALKK
jgi:hypothetical protein